MAESFRKESNTAEGHEVADEHYDIVSVIYHCLQGCETAKRYERDARDAGDEELAQYFAEVQRSHLSLANRGRHFLKGWVNSESVSEGSERAHRVNVQDKPLKASVGSISGTKDAPGGYQSSGRSSGNVQEIRGGQSNDSQSAGDQVQENDKVQDESESEDQGDRSQAV